MIIDRKKYVLRSWNKNDVNSLVKHINNINIWNNVRDGLPHPYTIKDAEEFIEGTLHKPYQQDFVIAVDGHAVGGVGIIPGHDVECLNAELGYWLGEEYWHKGIMSDAVRSVAEYIFGHYEIARLFAPVFEYNPASMKVLENAGFTKLAVMHKSAIKNGKIIDMHYYELVNPDIRSLEARLSY